MDRFERVFTLHKILLQRRTPISFADLQNKLDNCSRATVKRVIKDYREYLGAPLDYDRERNGYYLDKTGKALYELPGLWLNPSEILALLGSHRLLTEVQPGILEPYIDPLRNKMEKLLKHKYAGSKELFERIRILPMAQREPRLENFQQIADALVSRVQARIQYHSRSRDETSERWISPQRLVYYRDNWYLDAWCHKKGGLRTFSLDRLNVAEKGEKAIDIPEAELNAELGAAYGIFSGRPKHKAVIRFSGHAARWVADEQWHPEQESHAFGTDGWELVVPYSDPRELIMDILKYGPDAEVIEPVELRKMVSDKLSQALRKYRDMK